MRKVLRTPSSKLGKALPLVGLILAIALPTGLLLQAQGSATIASQATSDRLSASQPSGSTGSVVPVMVQKSDRSKNAEALVAELGGKVTKDLSIINAFAADVPQAALGQLAASPLVRSVTPDGPVQSSWWSQPWHTTTYYSKSINTYLDSLDVPQASQLTDRYGRRLDGDGIGVAVIDSGASVGWYSDLPDLHRYVFSDTATSPDDVYGHGTFVAGIIAGNGYHSNGLYKGIAPDADIYSLKISDEQGNARESDVVSALQWVLENKRTKNIRVVNLSLNAGNDLSYQESPLDAACEILWFNGVVVVTSAGNKGGLAGTYNTMNAAPANDPFVITVGALDEKKTGYQGDDTVASFSAHGVTDDGYSKPEILAPGKDIISVLSTKSSWDDLAPERVVLDDYFRASGTSMAAPMVTGTVALMLQRDPYLTPDRVKYRLLHSGITINGQRSLNAYAAVTSYSTRSANTGIPVSQLLFTGDDPVMWNSVMWNSVMWNSVMWNSVMWNSVMWNSVMWNSVDWSS